MCGDPEAKEETVVRGKSSKVGCGPIGEQLEARHLLTKLVDLDTDGDLDAVRAHAWYENTNGQGDFTEHTFASDANAKFQVADLDGDSDADVITSTGDWYENANGSLSTARSWNSTGNPLDAVRLTDNDFDGDLDIIAWGRENASLFVNEGGGTFTLQSSVDGPFAAAADFDKDGLLDKLVETGDGEFWLHRNLGDGSFETELALDPFPGFGVWIRGVADVDGNGYEDIIRGYQWSWSTYEWFGNDGEQFGGRGYHLGGGDALLFLKDVDQDGDLEAVTFRVASSVEWVYTEGNGGLRGNVSVSVPRETVTDVGDLNSDGHLDFVYRVDPRIWLDGSTLNFREQVEPTPIGDVNSDGLFSSSDLVEVFKAGEYEDDVSLNSTWEEGDWNRDGDFDSGDLVLALQEGQYAAAAIPMEAEIAAAVEAVFAESDRIRVKAFVP